ncbi:shikimate dehydrogenase [Asaia prunellae]|uniref:shikimate dehydrogenase n=1 Tax=Asaia prunellae TaxID=610245 RepID=UPI000554AC5C|nr:shikimate dehydrogenase [Asaia prunellae]
MKWLCGLIGEDIRQSRSPAMHEREARHMDMALEYRLIDMTMPQYKTYSLATMLDEMEQNGFAGTNITHPFKQKVIALLDDVSDAARQIGAVNTVLFRDGKRIGHNTDWSGYRENFLRGLPGVALHSVAQIGAGGAAAAVSYALLTLGVRQLSIFDLASDRADGLAANLTTQFPDAEVRSVRSIETALKSAQGVVQSTPIGMYAHPGTPFPPDFLTPDQWFSEVVYFPRETQLLKAARDRGCKVLDGVGMAVFQAADAFELFTGRVPDRERILREFD